MIPTFVKNNWMVLVAGLLVSPLLVATLPVLIDVGSSIQDRMIPVITDWKVTSSSAEGNDLIVSGTMMKNRDCVFLPPTLARDESGLNHRVASRASAGGTTWSHDEQPQSWGPWVVPGGVGKRLVFINVYLCGTGRPTIVELGAFP